MLTQQNTQINTTESPFAGKVTVSRDDRIAPDEIRRAELARLISHYDSLACREGHYADLAQDEYDQAVDAGENYKQLTARWEQYLSYLATERMAKSKRDECKVELLKLESGASCSEIAVTVAARNVANASPRNRAWAERRLAEEQKKAGK